MEANDILLANSKSEVCRVCLRIMEKSELMDLSTIYDEESQLDYIECFQICTQIDLRANANLPQNLCKACGFELETTYNFFKKVEVSKKFLEYYQQNVCDEVENVTMQIVPKHDNNDMELLTCIAVDDDDAEAFNSSPNSIVNTNDYQPEQVYTFVELTPETNGSCEIEISNEGLSESTDDNSKIDDERLGMEEFQYIEALDGEETEILNVKYNSNVYFGHNEEQDIVQDNDKEINILDLSSEVRDEEKDDAIDNSFTYSDKAMCVFDEEQYAVQEATDANVKPNQNVFLLTKNEAIYSIDNMTKLNNGLQKPVLASEEEALAAEKSAEIAIRKRQRHIGFYACDYCQKTFPNYSRMAIHRRSHEMNRPKYTCDSCGRMYCTKQALEVHVRTIHTKSGYSCTICSKVFAIKKSLEVHIRYHTGDFPYVCDVCGKKFAQMCHLNTHRNVKHNSVRFGCDYPDCGKFFTSSHSLRNHEFSHSVMPFECDFCQQGYPAKAKLKVHIKRKHGQEMSKDELEKMRKFYVTRSRVKCVKVIEVQEES